MRRSCPCIVACLLLLCALSTSRTFAGLYGDEGKNAKSGELTDRDYWQARWDMMMLDLAIKQYQEAASEMVAMDAVKKEILYSMGLIYERMGKKDESLKCMKDIYEVDAGYKDVTQRVEQSYGP